MLSAVEQNDRGWERHLDFEAIADWLVRTVSGAISTRTRDAIQIDIPGNEQVASEEMFHPGIVLLLTPEAIELRLPTVMWLGPHTLVSTSSLWKRVAWTRIRSDNALLALLEAARAARREQFNRCRYCGRLVPPEHRHREDVCHSCAERHLGVVH